MSWLTDPELFLDNVGATGCRLFRVRKKFGSPFTVNEFTFQSNVTNHFALVGNSFPWQKSDFDALAAFISRNDILVNCQGFVITLTFPRDRAANPDKSRPTYFWSHDVLDLPRYGLPVPTVPFRVVQFLEGGVAPVGSSPKENQLANNLAVCINDRDREKAEKQGLAKKNTELEIKISTLEDELKREKDDKNALINDRDRVKAEKEALEKRVSDLEVKNSTLEDEVKREKDDKNALINDMDRKKAEKQSLEKKVNALEANNATLIDDLKREKDDKNTLINDLNREKTEREALEKRVSDLEAKNSTLEDELKREKNGKNTLINELDQEKSKKQALEKRVSDLEVKNSTLKDEIADLEAVIACYKDKVLNLNRDLDAWVCEVSDLQEMLNREKNDKKALEKKVSELTAKLEECCGCGGGSVDKEPWMRDYTVPSNWVRFEELVQKVSRTTPLTITKSLGAANFAEDDTTNVKANYFSQGLLNARLVYPIVVVDVKELIPNKDKARFDPNIWGLFDNAGTCYAARKP